MVFTFQTPWDIATTCNAIKETVLSMNGTVRELSRGRLKTWWKTNQKKAGIFNHCCAFYVGDGIVRAVTDFQDTEVIAMVFPRMTRPFAFWNVFLENFFRRYPDADLGIKAGLPELVAIQFLDDGTEQILVSETENHPSLSGAIVGEMLFGTAGAIVGAASGQSRTTTFTHTQTSKLRHAMVRYSNGLIFCGKMFNNGSLYHEIMVNMRRLSAPVIPEDI